MKRSLRVFSHRDPEQRFREALSWLPDGIERALMHEGSCTVQAEA